LRHRRHRLGNKWDLEEVFLSIQGQRYYRWRTVDQDGNVLDILMQPQRDKAAAKKFFQKLLQGLGSVPRVMIADKLKTYSTAKRRCQINAGSRPNGIKLVESYLLIDI
jgi:putative transposase